MATTTDRYATRLNLVLVVIISRPCAISKPRTSSFRLQTGVASHIEMHSGEPPKETTVNQYSKSDPTWTPFSTTTGSEMLSACMRAQSGLAETLGELGRDGAAFMQAQIDTGLDAWKKLAQCKSADEIITCHQEMVASLRAQYLDYLLNLRDRVLATMTHDAVAPDQSDEAPMSKKSAESPTEKKREAA